MNKTIHLARSMRSVRVTGALVAAVWAGVADAEFISMIDLNTPIWLQRQLYTGQVIPVAGRRFSYKFSTPDTALFELAP